MPALTDNALRRTARRLDAPVLVSANALSVWRRDALGLRRWRGFDRRNLHLVRHRPVHLDGGGFVAAARYRGYPWGVREYVELCASAPWRWCAALDWCVEHEVAPDRAEVLDRISATVRLYTECARAARRHGIADRLLPVLQGWRPIDYLRCLDRMPDPSDAAVIGVGSMCRRHVHGEAGILCVVDALDRALEGRPTRLHLFGVKTAGMAELRDHPRVASFDSQAYGVQARRQAHESGFSKTDAYLAGVMAGWYRRQRELLAAPGHAVRPPPSSLPPPRPEPCGALPPALARRLERAAEEMRDLYEAGEIEWADLNPRAVWDWAFA